MKILLSNDDSVHAPALKILQKELKKLGTVWTVAPLEEKSTTGHSLTIHKPLRILNMGDKYYGVSGSPADCVYMGIREVIGEMPDLVVSGINRGANMGQDVYYSGTVSAAREACILGLPAFAVSTDIDHKKRKEDSEVHYISAAKSLVKIIKSMKLSDIPKHTLINVNVPDLPLSKIKAPLITRQGFRYYSGTVMKRMDHRGKPYYWIGGQYKGFHNSEGTDCHTLADGHISITPVKLDCTDYQYMNRLKDIFEE